MPMGRRLAPRTGTDGDPPLPLRETLYTRHEKRSDLLAAHDAREESGFLAGGDYGGDAPVTRQSRRPDLGPHPSDSGLTLVIGDVVVDLRADLDGADHLGGERSVAIRGLVLAVAEAKHAGDGAQDHEEIGGGQARDECSEMVVVSDLRFVVRERVILVDDRKDAPGQELL